MKAYIYQAHRGEFRETGTLVAPTRTHALRRLRQRAYRNIDLREIQQSPKGHLQYYDS